MGLNETKGIDLLIGTGGCKKNSMKSIMEFGSRKWVMI